MTENLLISVLIPVYNTEGYLKRCFESVLAQSYPHLEIIIINDGSTDSGYEICKHYQSIDSRIKLLSQENAGVSTALNLGLKQATGDWVLFVDSDDWIDVDAVQILVSKIERFPQVQLIRTFCRYVSEERTWLSNNNPLPDTCYSRNDFIQLDKIGGYISSLFVKRSIITEHQLIFNPSLLIKADLVFTWKCVLNAEKILISDHVFYNYYIRPNSTIRTINKRKLLNNLEAAEEVRLYAATYSCPAVDEAVKRYLQRGLASFIHSLSLFDGSKEGEGYNHYRSDLWKYLQQNKVSLSSLPLKSRLLFGLTLINKKLFKLVVRT